MYQHAKVVACAITAVCALLGAAEGVYAQTFGPNTIRFQSANVHVFVEGHGMKMMNLHGFYEDFTGTKNARPRCFVLPNISVDAQSSVRLSDDGRPIELADIRANPNVVGRVNSVSVRATIDSSSPSQEAGIAIASAISGNRLDVVEPRPLEMNLTSPPLPLALVSQINGASMAASKAWMDRYGPHLERWNSFVSSVAALKGVTLRLVVEGDVVASRSYPSTILTSETLPALVVQNPARHIVNHIVQNNFEVEVDYTFADSSVEQVSARLDLSQHAESALNEYRKNVQRGKTSSGGFFVFKQQSRSVKTFVDVSVAESATGSRSEGTTIVMRDLQNQAMVDRLEAIFYPEISEERTIANHVAAAAEAQRKGNTELARLHNDYVIALRDDPGNTKEIDVNKALAGAASGNWAAFVAHGVRFGTDSSRSASTYRRIVTTDFESEDRKEYDSAKIVRSDRVCTAVIPAKSAEYKAGLGILNSYEFTLPDGTPGGNVINAIGRGTALHKAGILPGMMIVGVDGKPALSEKALRDIVSEAKPGERVDVIFARFDSNGVWSRTASTLIFDYHRQSVR